jgi:hypothetical protein
MKEKIELTPNKIIQVREIIDGQYHRRCIAPTDDISNESDKVKALATEHFTKKVKDDYKKLF